MQNAIVIGGGELEMRGRGKKQNKGGWKGETYIKRGDTS